MKKQLAFTFILISLFLLTSSFFKKNEQVNWITFNEAFDLSKTNPKPTVIDLYTDWCGWCKKMDRNTYENTTIANYINENYYAVKFDAESKEVLNIGAKVFKYNPSKRTHELALGLMGGNASYPTTVFLNGDLRVIQAVPGYLDAEKFHQVSTFLFEDHYKSQPFEDYIKTSYKKP